MAKKKKKTAGEPERIFDWSGGMNNTVNPALLNDNESVLLQNYTLDEKGTLFPAKGAQDRYAEAFNNSPVAGMGPYYKSDGTTRLLIGTEDGKLFVDTPHLVNTYDTQGEFNEGKYQAAGATTDGKIWPMIMSINFENGNFFDFHTRDTGWTIDDTVYKTGTKSAKGTGKEQKLIRELGHSTGNIYVKLACYFAETDKNHFPVILISPSGSQIQAVVAASDGHFKYHNGSALANFPTDKTYQKETWYVVEVWMQGSTFIVSIDGEKLTTGLTLKDTSNVTQSQVTKVQIQNAGTEEAATWIDEVEINALTPTFSRNSEAYTFDGQKVVANQPRFEQGKFGNGVMVEEGTENLLGAENASFEGGTTGNWVNTTSTISVVDDGWHGSKGLLVSPTETNGRAQIRVDNKGLVTLNDTVTLSAYARLLSGDPKTVSIAITVGGVGAVRKNLTVYSNAWTRLSITHTLDSLGTGVYVQLYGGLYGGAQADVIFDGIQLEKNPYPTTFTPGTRSPETLTIPTEGVLNPEAGTISFWLYVTDTIREGSLYQSPQLFHVPRAVGGTMGIMLSHRLDRPVWQLRTHDDKNISSNGETSNEVTPIGWHLFSVKWSAEKAVLLIDGIPKITLLNPRLPSQFGGSAYFGQYVGQYHTNTLIDDLRISSVARTDEEILEAYNSGVPLPVDEDTTYKLSFDNHLIPAATAAWTSPTIDVSQAKDKASGHVALTADIPGSSSVTLQSRSASDPSGPWGAWVNALSDGSLQHNADDFIQARVILNRGDGDNPAVDKLVVSFDGQASTTLLAGDFTPGGQFFFGQITDYLAVVNGLDEPRKYDGDILEGMSGNPPHAAYVAVHKNRLWMAKGSRLYFSDLLNIDSWPILNFIDIMPADGDTITGLLVYGDYLIISKQHSMWMLTGEGINTFQVRRIHADRGVYAPRSICIVNQMLCFVSDDGIYFSDFTQPVLASERLRQTWAGLNKRRLNLTSSWFAEHKLYVAVPNGNSQRNNLVIVYDALRQAFAGVITGWNVSSWTDFREAGEINSYFGCSDIGQVKQINAGYNSSGQPYTAEYLSKEFSFGVPEVLKRWNKVYFQVKPAQLTATLTISFIVDGKETGAMTVNVPAEPDGLIHTLLVLASKVGVISGRRLGIRVKQNVLDNPVGIQTVYIESMPTLVKPTIWS